MRQSGYSREEVIGQTSLDLHFWVDPLEQAEIRKTLGDQGEVHNHEVRFRMKSGQVLDTLTSVVPVTIGGEECVVTLLQDITPEKPPGRRWPRTKNATARSRPSCNGPWICPLT